MIKTIWLAIEFLAIGFSFLAIVGFMLTLVAVMQ